MTYTPDDPVTAVPRDQSVAASRRPGRHRRRRRRGLLAAVGGGIATGTAVGLLAGSHPASPPAAVDPEPAPPAPGIPATTAPRTTPATPATGPEPAVGLAVAATMTAGTPRIADIPAPAIAAYQRAATILEQADPSCGLDWLLIAAVGHVASDHGRTSRPRADAPGQGALGPIVRQKDGSPVADSDAGQVDGDSRFDRGVGPMAMTPMAWAVAGVDADGDGRRDPLDLDDAALGLGVLLCSDTDDLSEPAGQSAALTRAASDPAWVALVLDVLAAYKAEPPPDADPDIVVVDDPSPDPEHDEDEPEVQAVESPVEFHQHERAPGGWSSGSIWGTWCSDTPADDEPDPEDPPENPIPLRQTAPSEEWVDRNDC